jgi:anti-sigma factor RsiW
MNCKRARTRLVALLDREIGEQEKALLTSHLESCTDCRGEMARLTRLSTELSLIEDVPVRPYFATRLKQRIADRQAKRASLPAWLRRVAIPAGVLSAVLLTALIGSSLGRTVYRWRTPADSGTMATTTSYSGSLLLDDSPEGPLGRVYDDLYSGGEGG